MQDCCAVTGTAKIHLCLQGNNIIRRLLGSIASLWSLICSTLLGFQWSHSSLYSTFSPSSLPLPPFIPSSLLLLPPSLPPFSLPLPSLSCLPSFLSPSLLPPSPPFLLSSPPPSPLTPLLPPVVYHHGKYATGGHYTCDVCHPVCGGWVRIDDSVLKPVSEEMVLRQNQTSNKVAYLLFYRRVDSIRT